MIGLIGSLLFSSCSEQAGDAEPVIGALPASEVGDGVKSSAQQVSNVEAETSPAGSAEITVVSIDHLFGLKQADQVLLVDCRAALIHRIGSIDGSINLPTKQFDTSYPKRKAQLDAAINADKVIVLYCQNEKCPYAYTVAKKLSKKGIPVTIYDGGWEEWKRAGFE